MLLLIVIAVFALAMLGMSVGVLFSNRRLQGSCGGLSAKRDERGRARCDLCCDPSSECVS